MIKKTKKRVFKNNKLILCDVAGLLPVNSQKRSTFFCNAIKAPSVMLKVGLSPSKKIVLICFIESPLKMMKNAFYFVLKVLFVLEILKFLPWLFDCVEKRLDKKAQVNSKMYDATGYTTSNYNTCMSNTSGSKGNQAMKFGQLIEYNTKNIFLQKSYTKCVEEASP